jgi:hypothetical protein
MKHIHACLCGHEQKTTAEASGLGRVIQCEACKTVWAHVYPHKGGRAWIKVDPSDVKFHRLLEEVV